MGKSKGVGAGHSKGLRSSSASICGRCQQIPTTEEAEEVLELTDQEAAASLGHGKEPAAEKETEG